MATATIYPTTASGTSWSNPTNALAEDSSYASLSSTSRNTTYTLTATFGDTSSIPYGATINSITAYVKGYLSSNVTHTTTLGGNTITFTKTSNTTVSTSLSSTTIPSTVSFTIRKTKSTSMAVYVDCIWLEVEYELPPNPTSVTISQSTATIKETETVQLTASVLPSDADQSITWKSSSSSIATVSSSGLVTGVGVGTCTITARSTKDTSVYATCEVTVIKDVVRLFPYEIRKYDNMTETATTENSVNLSINTTEATPWIQYILPNLTIGQTYKISFDYEKDGITEDVTFILYEYDKENDAVVADTSYEEKTSSPIGNYAHGFKASRTNYVLQIYIKNRDSTYFNLSNFVLEECSFIWDLAKDTVRATTTENEPNSNTTIITPTDGSNYYNVDWIIPNLTSGTTYKLVVSYSGNTGGINLFVEDKDWNNLYELRKSTNASETLEIIFTAPEGITYFTINNNNNTYNTSPITFTVISLGEFKFIFDEYYQAWTETDQTKYLSENSVTVSAQSDMTSGEHWERDWYVPNLVDGKTYKITFDYTKTNDTSVDVDIVNNGGVSTISTNTLTANSGSLTITFTASSDTLSSDANYTNFYVFGVGSYTGINTITLSNIVLKKVFTKTNGIVMSIKGNTVYLIADSREYLTDIGIQNVVADVSGTNPVYLDSNGILHCAKLFDDYNTFLKGVSYVSATTITSGWSQNTTYTIDSDTQVTVTANTTSDNQNWETDLQLNLDIGYCYVLEYDYENTTGNDVGMGVYDDTDGDGQFDVNTWRTRNATSGSEMHVFRCSSTDCSLVLSNWNNISSISGTVIIKNIKLRKLWEEVNATNNQYLKEDWAHNNTTVSMPNTTSMTYTIGYKSWEYQHELPVDDNKKYKMEFDITNNTSNQLVSSVRGNVDENGYMCENYVASGETKHIINMFTPINIKTRFCICTWVENDSALATPVTVDITNFQIDRLADDFQIGIFEVVVQGGDNWNSSWNNVDGRTLCVTVLANGSFGATVDFYGKTFVGGKTYNVSFDYEKPSDLTDVGLEFNFWNTDTSNGTTLFETSLSDTSGHFEGTITIPADNGHPYMYVNGTNSSSSQVSLTFTNFVALLNYFAYSSLELWWNTLLTISSSNPTSITYAYDGTGTVKNKEAAHKIKGLDTNKEYYFEADLTLIVNTTDRTYTSVTFYILDANNTNTEYIKTNFGFKEANGGTMTNKVTGTFKPNSDTIAIYSSIWQESSYLTHSFTFTATNIRLTEN